MAPFRSFALVSVVVGVGILVTPRGLRANESAPVVVTMGGTTELRVQISEGITRPCDSANNRPLFDGRLKPGEAFRTSVAGDCICIRHTTSSFPESDWTQSGLACRRRTCRGKFCTSASDPTIYVSLP